MVVLGNVVFFLVYPLTQWRAEQTLEVLCDLGVFFARNVREAWFARQLRLLCHCFQQ